jgi:hypothetical protein
MFILVIPHFFLCVECFDFELHEYFLISASVIIIIVGGESFFLSSFLNPAH